VDPPQWIVVPNWRRLQHYKDRRPVWIKLYPELLDDPAYLSLPVGTRLLLIELWMLYASSRGQITVDTASLSRRLQHRTTSRQLAQLSDAGFIQVSASKPLAQIREEKRREDEDAPTLSPSWPTLVRPMQ
jgi:hypothetical protein